MKMICAEIRWVSKKKIKRGRYHYVTVDHEGRKFRIPFKLQSYNQGPRQKYLWVSFKRPYQGYAYEYNLWDKEFDGSPVNKIIFYDRP